MQDSTRVFRIRDSVGVERDDRLAVEEPLEIRVGFGPPANRARTVLSITMRTPGHDADLAVGLLFAEGVISGPADVVAVVPSDSNPNAIRVDLHPNVSFDPKRLDRHLLATSACGICGATSLDAVESRCEGPRPGPVLPASRIPQLPELVRAAQPAFAATGGLHAAAFFDVAGNLLAVREDVGRHNAADKLIGAEVRAGRVPLRDRILVVSGRASFELVQKAAVAGVPIFAAVGAPSSLAVDLASRMGITLLGFVRDGRFNVYCGGERLA